jgi:hypothetical protein
MKKYTALRPTMTFDSKGVTKEPTSSFLTSGNQFQNEIVQKNFGTDVKERSRDQPKS